MTAIPTAQTNATAILPSYLFQEYSDDEDLQAFVGAYNSLAQGYLDWFNNTPLPVWTSAAISGALLDWVGSKLYGIRRPVIGTSSSFSVGPINTFAINTMAVDAFTVTSSGTATLVNDDIYKRVLTWWFYRGDGRIPSIDWLLRRVTRFLYGVDGADVIYPPILPNVVPLLSVNSGNFVIGAPNTGIGQTLQALVNNHSLALPFEISFSVSLGTETVLTDDAGIQLTDDAGNLLTAG